jgi:hypothetical protein
MISPFTTITVNQFHKLEDVYVAADRFLKVAAEFPDHPSAWNEQMVTLENAVENYKKDRP